MQGGAGEAGAAYVVPEGSGRTQTMMVMCATRGPEQAIARKSWKGHWDQPPVTMAKTTMEGEHTQNGAAGC